MVLPADFQHVDMEAELVAVIGKKAKNVSEADALDYVLGYTVRQRRQRTRVAERAAKDISWWRAKSADTFSPIGPVIETDIDPTDVEIRGSVNGVEGQKCHTSEMIFNVVQAISYISRYVTLEPGDLIFTGTAGAPPALKSRGCHRSGDRGDRDFVEPGCVGFPECPCATKRVSNESSEIVRGELVEP